MRLRELAYAVATVERTDTAKLFARQTRALESVVKVDAYDTASVLIADCRRSLVALNADGPSLLASAAVVDGRAALNRLANMIRCNDPDPADPRGGNR